MHGSQRPFIVSLVLALLVVPFAGGAFGADEAEQQVEQVGEELGEAARALERIEAALAAAEREIAAAEQRLREAAGALASVEEELAAAERAEAAAEATRRNRVEELAAAEADVEAAEARYAAATAQLHDRSVEVYKYGTGRPQQALVAGVLGANDWHEVAVTTSTVSRLVANDRALVTDAARAREEADDAQAAATDAKIAAIAAEERAREQGAELRALVEEHEAAVAAVEEERAQREAVLAELEEDSELAAMLVATLERELASAREKQAAAEQAAAERAAAAEAAAAEAAAAEQQRAAAEEQEEQPAEGDEPSDDPPPSDAEGAAPAWAAKLPAAGQPWAAEIDAAATANGVDAPLFAALVWTESHFNPQAQSWVGAIGLAQLMPATAASLGVDPWDPIQNLDGGARYLAKQYQTFGQLELALAAYNAGPTAVWASGPGIPNYVETQLYVVRVLERYNHLAG